MKLILNRLVQTLMTLLIVTTLTFAMLAAAGGDVLNTLSADPLASAATVQQMRHIYGLDQPLPVRYWRWLEHTVRGDMGESFYYHAPVSRLLFPRLLNTMMLALLALFMAWSVALTLGMMAARRVGSWADRSCEAIILLASSTPRLVLALVVLALASQFSLLNFGSGAALSKAANPVNRSSSWLQIVLPAVVLAVPLMALFLAQVRDGVRQALREDFVMVARAKGLRERDVLFRHALRAALNPLITIFGYSLGGVMSGSVIVETILDWPGLGALSVVAVQSRDVPLMLGIVIITATAVFAGNLLADILLHLNDPRLRQNDQRHRSVQSVATR
ncbi:MAG: ABC transporter permease [Acidobacteria bacterium]|nr:ABC transporter permease [Acidobacteriota bacterium]